jgi:alkylhydroperoxidase family enzyme
VSRRNECTFCAETHGAVARHLSGADEESAEQDPRLRALLGIAEKVRVDGRSVTADDIAGARAAGADDRAIHDTVLIAAAFSMFNRYVDGLGALTPEDPALYEWRARTLAEHGYLHRPG